MAYHLFVSVVSYSCCLVFITLYNLLLEISMTSPYIFLDCVVPNSCNKKSGIDIYFHPLIDKLQLLWHEGVET